MKLLAEMVIQSVDWSAYELLTGPADGFGERLAEFVSPYPTVPREQLWQTMENHVFAQDDVFSGSSQMRV